MGSRSEAIETLRTLLREHFRAVYGASRGLRDARTQGRVDGYMEALLRAGLASQRELLRVVREERERVAGPAVAAVAADGSAGLAVATH